MPDKTERWTREQFEHFQKTGETPDQAANVEKRIEKRARMAEKELQTTVEQWLHHRGYRRLTADNAAETGQIGWFGHLVETKKNPLMPDLFIFNTAMDQCLMLELKVKAVYQPGQKEMISRGSWVQAFTFQEAEAAVKKWEAFENPVLEGAGGVMLEGLADAVSESVIRAVDRIVGHMPDLEERCRLNQAVIDSIDEWCQG